MRKRWAAILVSIWVASTVACARGGRDVPASIAPGCADLLPELPVDVADTGTWLGPGGTQVSFTDARGCVYWVQRYSRGLVAEDPFGRVSPSPVPPECLYFGRLSDRSDRETLDPDSELGQRVLNALRDWLKRTAPGASFASIKATTTQRYPTEAEVKILRVLTIVDGLERRLCSER